MNHSLAYLEMRLLLSHVLFQFDLELSDKSAGVDWFDQESHILWEKQPLFVKMTSVN